MSYENNSKQNEDFPGMPFIAVKIENQIIKALIDTAVEKSAIKLETLRKYNIFKKIDRQQTDDAIGLFYPIKIYGSIYD